MKKIASILLRKNLKYLNSKNINKMYKLNKKYNSHLYNFEDEVNRNTYDLSNINKINCLMLHPLEKKNTNPLIEAYLAEEAIGLAKSLNWEIIKGPFLSVSSSKYKLSQKELILLDKYKERQRNLISKKIPKNPKNGDYIIEDGIKGVYQNNGLLIDVEEENEDLDQDILNSDAWKHVSLRHSLALSSIVKINEVKASTYLNKYKLSMLCSYLDENKVDSIFFNTALSVSQKRNMEKYINNYLLNRMDRVRKYNLKSAMKNDDATDTHSNFSNVSDNELTTSSSVKILDRFDVILNIFSSRATSIVSKCQLELAYLKYAKSMLNRNISNSYQPFSSYFSNINFNIDSVSNVNSLKENKLYSSRELVSGKQSSKKGSLGGAGEKQLEIDKRLINQRENIVKKKLKDAEKNKLKEINTRKERNIRLPSCSLIGYTNSGKTAIMNLLTKSNLESEDLLFRTLNTTIKKVSTSIKHKQNEDNMTKRNYNILKQSNDLNDNFYTSKGNSSETANFMLLDTVGFISNLPHELVDSFKSTLDEIFHSDMLLHVVDISNPMWEFQAKVVYKVLDDMYPDKSYKNKIIEVWNKIDLLSTGLDSLSDKISDNNIPIIPISALKKINIKNLVTEIKNNLDYSLDKKNNIIEIHYEQYERVLNWLRINIGEPNSINYSDDGNLVRISISMTSGQSNKYLQNFVLNNNSNKLD